VLTSAVVQELARSCWATKVAIVTMATLQKDQVIIFILQLDAYALNKNIENKVFASEYKLYFCYLRLKHQERFVFSKLFYPHRNKACMLSV